MSWLRVLQFKITYFVLICILRLFGLFPFCYHRFERRFSESKVYFLYSVILLGLYVYFSGSYKWSIIKTMGMESSQYNAFLMASGLVTIYLGVITTSLVALLYSHKCHAIFNDLLRLWYGMRTCSGIAANLDRKLLVRFFIKIFFIDGGFFLAIAYANWNLLFGHADVNDDTVLFDTLYNLHNFASNATFTNMFVAICLLGAHLYRVINVRILNVHHKIEQVSTVNSSKRRLVFSRLARELHQLSQWHGQINQLVHRFMDLHGPSLSAMVLKYFVIIVASLFGAYFVTVRQLSLGRPVHAGMVTFHGMMFSFYFIQYYYLVASAALFTKRADKAGAILDIFADVEGSDGRLDVLIESFSLELLHRSNKIENRGMFTIDYSLIYEALSRMVGYLIIAVQFQISIFSQSIGESSV